MEPTKWTDDEIRLLRDITSKGNISYEKIAKQYFPSRGLRGIKSKAQLLGFHNKFCGSKIHSQDETFFSIPNLINSYFAGFLAADGALMLIRGRPHLGLCISAKDRHLIETFNQLSKSTNKIGVKWQKSPRSDNVTEIVYIRYAGVDQWFKDLGSNFNIIPQKTFRLGPPPALQDIDLKLAYMVGILDGDGYIGLSGQKDGHSAITFTFASASKTILDWIDETVEGLGYKGVSAIRHHSGVIKSKRDNVYLYNVSGLRAAKLLLRLRALPVPKLARKWDNPVVLDRIKKYAIDYPGQLILPDDMTSSISPSSTPALLPVSI
jgi:hypothetical protein